MGSRAKESAGMGEIQVGGGRVELGAPEQRTEERERPVLPEVSIRDAEHQG